MKGIIFNLVEEAVTARHGDSVWDEVLTAAGLDGAYTALGSYPSDELHRLVAAGARRLDTTPDELTRRIGEAALLGLAERHPHYFAPFTSVRPFLLTLNDVIHPEVRKLHPQARPPEFRFEALDPDGLVIHYRSDRGLCALAEGMIAGAATYFGEKVLLTQTACTRDGATHCVFDAELAAV